LSGVTRGGMALAEPVRSLLDPRLVIVTGKGGTGKTTVVAALALAAAERGRRVLVVETGREEHVPRLLAPNSEPVGYQGREIRRGLTAMRVDPYQALAEYLGLQLRMPALVSRMMRYKGFRQLMDASPGWRELITLGKVWHLEQQQTGKGEPRYDLLLVDAPATGHGLTFLDVPRVVVSALRAGPLRRHAGWVEEMLRDPIATLLVPVALAEELPARETVELVARIREGMGIPVDRVVINAVLERPFPEDFPDLDEQLARIPEDRVLTGLPPVPVIASCASHLRSRFELNRRYVEEIARASGLPTQTLPYLRSGIRGPEDIEVLAAVLVGPANGGTA
jgi:anion-transporting  ArsA/GET3 family ATPase